MGASRSVFATTHWSVVLAAGRNDTTRAHDALAKLCCAYWYTLYAHARRRGCSPLDAQDFTQEFFAHLIEHQSLVAADPQRGRFRSFLLAAMNNFLDREWAKARAKKRGGGKHLLSLDWAAAERRFDLEPVDASSPDKIFDRHWAMEVLDNVLTQLEAEYRREDKMELFLALKHTLMGTRESQPYATLAAGLNMEEGAIKVGVHRLRKRYRELIRTEIADTVASPEEIGGEMKHLLDALAGR